MSDREFCGKWMPISKKACGRPAGHKHSCKAPDAIARTVERNRDSYRTDPEYRQDFLHYLQGRYRSPRGRAVSLLGKARQRAAKRGIAFDLTLEWVETELEFAVANGCPYLGTPIRLDSPGFSPNSPTIEQFNPGGGYTQDNCIIVSHRANVIKNDASLAELEMLARNVKLLGQTRFPNKQRIAS